MTHTVRVNVGSIDRPEVVEARESVGEGVRGPLSAVSTAAILSDSSRKESVAPESGLVRSEIMRVKRRAIVMTATIVVIEPRRAMITTTVAMTGR
jgi:hypothetical protein